VRARGRVFTRAEVACWEGGSADRQYGLVKRALASGEVQRVRRGLYCLAEKYRPGPVDPFVLAQRVYGPSYVSLESALSYHGWIPEAVYAVTSVSLERSREFDTPVGLLSYTRVPQKVLYAGVDRVETPAGESFLLASPLKALADYVYVHKLDVRSAGAVVRSLRVDAELLAEVSAGEAEALRANYPSRRVRRLLAGVRKELSG